MDLGRFGPFIGKSSILARSWWKLSMQEAGEPTPSQRVTPLSDCGRLHYLSIIFPFLPDFAILLQKYCPCTPCLGPNFMTYWEQWNAGRSNSMSASTCDLKRHGKLMPAFWSFFPLPVVKHAPESHCFFSLGPGMNILELTKAHP